MPAETLAEPPLAAAPEQAEHDYTAEEFCMAFGNVYMAQREAAAEIMNVPAEKLSPHYIGTHYGLPEHSMAIISKVKEVMDSALCDDRVERLVEKLPGNLMLHQRELVIYLSRLSATCFAGAAADYLLAKDVYFQSLDGKHAAKRHIIKAHEQFAYLPDNKLGKMLGINRQHLRFMANHMYGEEGAFNNMALWFETGVSAEVATKRGFEAILRDRQEAASVRYSTPDEDLKGSDLVVTINGKRLLIDVKSSGRVYEDGHYVQAPAHSGIEVIDRDTYYIKRLHPANIESIGVDFTVDAGYQNQLREVVGEFVYLSREKKRHHVRHSRQPWGSRGVRLARPALRFQS